LKCQIEGDLVKIEADEEEFYLVVEKDYSFEQVSLEPYWILWKPNHPIITMTERWIETANKRKE